VKHAPRLLSPDGKAFVARFVRDPIPRDVVRTEVVDGDGPVVGDGDSGGVDRSRGRCRRGFVLVVGLCRLSNGDDDLGLETDLVDSIVFGRVVDKPGEMRGGLLGVRDSLPVDRHRYILDSRALHLECRDSSVDVATINLLDLGLRNAFSVINHPRDHARLGDISG